MSRRIVLVDIGEGLTLSGILPSVALHAAYSAKLVARGGVAPYTYKVTGALPTGLTPDPATGILSAFSVDQAGTFPFTGTVTDVTGASASRNFSLQVTSLPLTVTGKAPDGQAGTAYSYTYSSANGRAPITWSISAGALPAGVTLNPSTGTISGMPTADGTPSWTIKVTDADRKAATLADGVSISAPTNAVLSLLRFDGSDGSSSITDETGRLWVAHGNAKISTADAPFGTSSIYFPGDQSSYLSTEDAQGFDLGANPWTIKMWVKWLKSSTQDLMCLGIDKNIYFGLFKRSSGSINFWRNASLTPNDVLSTPVGVVAINQWGELAITNDDSNILRIFWEGEKQAEGTWLEAGDIVPLGRLTLGMDLNAPAGNTEGYIKDFYIVSGRCLYTDNYTPVVAPVPYP